ncbi:threonine/serine exporter family protein [Eubacterium sp.]
MKEAVIQIITATTGALGFSIFFRVSEKNVLASTIGGGLGWALFLLINHLTDNMFLSNFAAALFVYLYSQIMSRILKAPSNVYLVPGTIPLIPGGALYYTMRGLLDGDKVLFWNNLKTTAIVTFGLAAGIVIGTVMITYAKSLKVKKKKV